jgi:uncharacterized glyoxalase superfamily protein PhnB
MDPQPPRPSGHPLQWSRTHLEAYRATLLKNGIAAGEIAQERLFGHDYFQVADPDGHGITVYTSHVGELPV